MARPPSDTNEAFLREVDENLRRDQAEQFVKNNLPLILAAVLLLLQQLLLLLHLLEQEVRIPKQLPWFPY